MMAISVEHLGAQVQCPHCAAVVQTPPRSALGPLPGPDPQGAAVEPPRPQYEPPAYQPPPQYPSPSIHAPERESIFAESPSDDVFGHAASSQAPMLEAEYQQHVAESAPTIAMDEPSDEPDAEQANFVARQRLAQARRSSNIAPTILTFLIPYSILTSFFVGYLLYMWPSPNQFEWLKDPKPDAKPRIVLLPRHDLELPAKLKTPLGNTVRIGQMEITPLKVAKRRGDLVLEFKAKNVSSNQIIRPIEREFFFESKGGSNTAKPYTFLEEIGKESGRIYGGELRFIAADNRPNFDGELRPGEECTVELSTYSDEKVSRLLKDDAKYRWRVQVRRGLETVNSVPTSVTAVVGVEFSKNEIANRDL